MFIKRAQSKFKVEQVYSYKDLQEGLVKVAGKNVTAKLVNKIASIPAIQAEPENYLYIRNRSVSGLDTWGCNSNFDAFPSEELQTAYASFVRVGISVDHINNGEDDLIGLVLDSEYVPKQLYCINDNTLHPFSEEKRVALLKEGKKLKVVGDYVENLLCLDKKLANEKRAGLVDAILNGEVTDTSMGCSVQESECSICGNKAKSEHEYCEHVPASKGRMVSYNGLNPKLCYEINRGLDFFEDSIILSETFAKKSGTSAQAGGEGADTGAKILEVVANKKPSILDGVKKRSNSASSLSDDTVVIGEEPKELEQKREEYEESREDYFEDGKTSMRIEDKEITAKELKSFAIRNSQYANFEKEVSAKVGEISTPSRIKLRSFYKTFQERHRDEVLAVAKHIVDTQDGINQESLKERLVSHGFNQQEVDEALAYQVKVKGNYDVSSKLKNFLVEGMKLYNEIDKTADLSGVNYSNTMNTGLAELVDRYNDSKMDDTGDLDETTGGGMGKNYIGEEPIGETRAMKKTADLKNEILQFVNGQSEVPKETIFGRFGYQPEINQAIEDLVVENKVTVDEYEEVHAVTDDINNSNAEAEANAFVAEEEEAENSNAFSSVESFEKYLTSPQSDWVILSATDQNKTQDANGNSIPAYLHPENIEANEKLKTDIKALGLEPVEANGVYLGNAEGKSYLVNDASLKDGVFLGLKYNQESILVPQGIYTLPKVGTQLLQTPNDVSEAMIHQGELAPITTSNGAPVVYWGEQAKEQDGYTTLNIGGEDIAFSFDIDWNGIKPFSQYLSKTSGLVEDEAKDSQEIKDDAEIIKYTDDEDLTKESKNTMIERLELTARRLNKEFEKFAGAEVWIPKKGDKVVDSNGQQGVVIDYNPEEMVGNHTKFPKGQVRVEYRKYGKFPKQGTYIEPLVELRKTAGKDSDKVKQEKMDIGGVGSPDSDGHYNTEEMDLSQGSGDPANYKDLKKNQDSEFTTDEDGMVQKVKSLRNKIAEMQYKSDEDIRKEFDNFKVQKIEWRPSGTSGWVEISFPNGGEHVGGGTNELSTGFSVYDSGKIAFDHWMPEDVYNKVVEIIKKDRKNPNKIILSHLSELADDKAEDAEKDKEDYGFEMNDEILDDKEIKGNMEDTLKDKKSNRMFEDYDKEEKDEDSEDENVEDRIKEAKKSFDKLNNAMTLDADPINLDSENSSSLGTETDNLGNEDASGVGKIISFLKDTMSAFEDDFDTPEDMDYSIKTDEDAVAELEKKSNTVPYNVNPADQVEIKNETGGTEATGSVADVKEEVNADGSTSPTVELSDGKTYPADEHMIQKTMSKSAKLLELENMDFGDTDKLSKLASLEAIELDSVDIPENIVTSAVKDSTEAESMISDNEAGEVFDAEPVVKRSGLKPKVGSGFMVNPHGSLKPRNAELNLETMWED